MSFIGAKIVVKGVVQGVGFRYWALRKANQYGLPGYVANLMDGNVKIEVEGERAMVEAFLNDVKVGPSYSHVTDLNIEWYDEPAGHTEFTIKL